MGDIGGTTWDNGEREHGDRASGAALHRVSLPGGGHLSPTGDRPCWPEAHAGLWEGRGSAAFPRGPHKYIYRRARAHGPQPGAQGLQDSARLPLQPSAAKGSGAGRWPGGASSSPTPACSSPIPASQPFSLWPQDVPVWPYWEVAFILQSSLEFLRCGLSRCPSPRPGALSPIPGQGRFSGVDFLRALPGAAPPTVPPARNAPLGGLCCPLVLTACSTAHSCPERPNPNRLCSLSLSWKSWGLQRNRTSRIHEIYLKPLAHLTLGSGEAKIRRAGRKFRQELS